MARLASGTLCWSYYVTLAMLVLVTPPTYAKWSVQLHVVRADGQPHVEVTWSPPPPAARLTLTWAQLTYSSQVTLREVGEQRLEAGAEKHLLQGLRPGLQYRVCVAWKVDPCPETPRTCSYVTPPHPAPPSPAHTDTHAGDSLRSTEGNLNLRTPSHHKPHGPPLYLVLGPVHSKNLTVTWGEVEEAGPRVEGVTQGYKLSWRRVEGSVNHPGHSSNLVSSRHLVRGLTPGTRYEVCVGETLAAAHHKTCDVIVTEEDVPGPPRTDDARCSSQAMGTHWRCDVSWEPPLKTHGAIIGYRVEWKDREGFVLTEGVPRGTLCEPRCYESQVVNFHPTEVCVTASTRAGTGWEGCHPIQDVSGRVLALLELRLLVVVMLTVVCYRYGATLLKAFLRCCILGLYRHVESYEAKAHPV